MKNFLTLALLLGAFATSPLIAGCGAGCSVRSEYVEDKYEGADDLDGQDEGSDDVDGNEQAEEIDEGRAA